ncbi:MAG TPA: sarcosine oxidase subunit delta [Alphaproteobacteria bacterium]|nr:sarcosine oxidase subunit delta [Alphaproteobacteria bacterium]
MIIPCPWCGRRDLSEFTYGGDATVARPEADASTDGWHDYVYLRDNPRGLHEELWQHTQGCRQWLRVRRDMTTHDIVGTALAAQPARAEGR